MLFISKVMEKRTLRLQNYEIQETKVPEIWDLNNPLEAFFPVQL